MTRQNRQMHGLFLVLCLLVLLLFSSPSHSCLLTGSDWNGADLIPENGDVLSGVFTNVGSFRIDEGSSVMFSSPLEIVANSISIYGSLGSNDASTSLSLSAVTIYLASSAFISVPLNSGSIIMSAMPVRPDGPTGSLIVDAGGSITISSGSVTPVVIGSVPPGAAGTVTLTGGSIVLIQGGGIVTSAGTLDVNNGGIVLAGVDANPVPLPSTAILFGSAFAGFGLLRKKYSR